MDFIDPAERRRHAIMLHVGYFLIGIAVLLCAVILLYLAFGFGLGKNGQVIQNGLVFVSSRPSSAKIYLNGSLYKSNTNTRMQLPEGLYNVELKREGYRTWDRKIAVKGGVVERYDYPFLIPQNLVTKTWQSYKIAPNLATQSIDQRRLLLQSSSNFAEFSLLDLKNPKNSPTTITLPSGVLTAGNKQKWKLAEWADDNKHVLLRHSYDGHVEYILVDINDPTQSVNLSKTLDIGDDAVVQLSNKKYDQYYIYTAKGGVLQTASLDKPSPVKVLSGVLGFKTYDNNMVLYATASKTKGQADIELLSGNNTYQIRQLPLSSTYLLNLTKYSGTWYMAIGSKSADKVYVYKDPVGQIQNRPHHNPAAVTVLKMPTPTYVSFSNNARFIMAENGQYFGVYDAEYEKKYEYHLPEPVDAPQPHASWMDGNHLDYVSKGKLLIFDFDQMNHQALELASPAYPAFFSPDYKFVYSLTAPDKKTGATNLTSTALLTPADQ